MLEAEARKRQAIHGNTAPGRPKSLSQKIDSVLGKSTEQAAKVVKTNRQYISDAKKLKAEAPEVYESVKAGEMNMYPTT